MLGNEHRYSEAAEIYEKLLKIQPENADLMALQAAMLSQQANGEADLSKARSLNKRARALAEQAEKLGTTNPMPPLLLASIKPDGSTVEVSKGTFSKRDQVDQLMHDGEAAFGRHDFAKAGECYQKAAELEPTNYIVALYSGDAYFSAREMVKACEWFRKAIAISPDTEMAHRYLGDALAKRSQHEEALKEWITALICEPYARTTRQHFTEAMRAASEARGHAIPRFPAMQSKVAGEKIELSVNPDDGILIMAYNICAMGWRAGDFAKRFPTEKTPRRSLPEEVSGIEGMLAAAAASAEEDKADLKKWQPVIDGLIALKRDGLLEAYIFLERADKELAKDYASYRTEHRDQLERYIRIYWCGLE